jgi:hypothetical protein
MKLWGTLGAAALLGVTLALPVQADEDSVYTDLSGGDIVALLDSHGYQATLTTDEGGDPLVMASADGLTFKVYTYDCNKAAPRRCQSIQFTSSFSLGHKATADDFKMMNNYNRNKIYGRAFIDQNGDAAIDFTIDLSGGVLAGNLMSQVSTWKSYVLDRFVTQLGWKVS